MASIGLDPDPDLVDAARSHVMADKHQSAVCAAALGEVLVKCTAEGLPPDKFQDGMQRLYGWFEKGVLVHFVFGELQTDLFHHVEELRRIDHQLTPCDATIIASMIEDPEADVLATTDDFATRPRVRDYVQEQGCDFITLDQFTGPRRRNVGGNKRGGPQRKG